MKNLFSAEEMSAFILTENCLFRRKALRCFMSEDAGHIRKNIAYKAVINGITFKRPFENCGFSDLDNFTLRAEADGKSYILTGCMWDDFFIAADKERFREHISVIALRLRTETENEGT